MRISLFTVIFEDSLVAMALMGEFVFFSVFFSVNSLKRFLLGASLDTLGGSKR